MVITSSATVIFVIIFYRTLGKSLQPELVPGAKIPVEPSCDTVHFTQKTGVQMKRFLTRSSNLHDFCHPISTNVLTTVNLTAHPGCFYQVIGYSGPHCEDDGEVKRVTANVLQPMTTFNERQSLCSFKLLQTSSTWVTVVFTEGTGRSKLHRVRQNDCYNLCSSTSEGYYPNSVEVYQGDTTTLTTTNALELFSKRHCENDTFITELHGGAAITKVGNLAALTRKTRPADPVQSYKIVRGIS